MNVGEVHEEDLSIGVVLGALHASTSRPTHPHAHFTWSTMKIGTVLHRAIYQHCINRTNNKSFSFVLAEDRSCVNQIQQLERICNILRKIRGHKLPEWKWEVFTNGGKCKKFKPCKGSYLVLDLSRHATGGPTGQSLQLSTAGKWWQSERCGRNRELNWD